MSTNSSVGSKPHPSLPVFCSRYRGHRRSHSSCWEVGGLQGSFKHPSFLFLPLFFFFLCLVLSYISRYFTETFMEIRDTLRLLLILVCKFVRNKRTIFTSLFFCSSYMLHTIPCIKHSTVVSSIRRNLSCTTGQAYLLLYTSLCFPPILF